MVLESSCLLGPLHSLQWQGFVYAVASYVGMVQPPRLKLHKLIKLILGDEIDFT